MMQGRSEPAVDSYRAAGYFLSEAAGRRRTVRRCLSRERAVSDWLLSPVNQRLHLFSFFAFLCLPDSTEQQRKAKQNFYSDSTNFFWVSDTSHLVGKGIV